MESNKSKSTPCLRTAGAGGAKHNGINQQGGLKKRFFGHFFVG